MKLNTAIDSVLYFDYVSFRKLERKLKPWVNDDTEWKVELF